MSEICTNYHTRLKMKSDVEVVEVSSGLYIDLHVFFKSLNSLKASLITTKHI